MAIDFTQLKKANDPNPPRLLVYGQEKIGKTTLAAGAPDPVFLLTEEGAGLNEIASVPSNSYAEFVDHLEQLATQAHGFKTLVIDSATGLEKLVFAKVCEDNNVASIEEAMGGFGKGYVRAAELWTKLIEMIDYVRKTKEMMVIILAHADIVKVSPPDDQPYDKYSIRMNKHTLGGLQKWVDGIFFMKKRIGFVEDKQTKKKRVVGGDERYIQTVDQAASFGGNRYDLPELIGPITKGAPELWIALVDKVPFLRDRYGSGKTPIAVAPEETSAPAETTEGGAAQAA